MDYEQIKQIIKDMENSKLTKLDIELQDGVKIRMEKAVQEENRVAVTNFAETANTVDTINTKEGFIVKSPMVGTFYIKSSPDSSAYVEIGSNVKKGDILCIIEAMKLMNEIESEYEGKIVEIYAKDGEPVEYGMPLFRIA